MIYIYMYLATSLYMHIPFFILYRGPEEGQQPPRALSNFKKGNDTTYNVDDERKLNVIDRVAGHIKEERDYKELTLMYSCQRAYVHS